MQAQPLHSRPPVEWPTVVLAALIYGGWLGVTALFQTLPTWLLVPLAAWLIAWHMSLQHEVLHGHPTSSQRLNDLLAFPPLSLWLPYARYREYHLSHHRGGNLTDPTDDPESYYVTRASLYRRSGLHRTLLHVSNTLAGRLLLGPPRAMAGFLGPELGRLLAGDRAAWRIWLPHLVGVGVILFWLHARHIGLVQYFAVFIYPGLALSLVRSFAEHRAAARLAHRTAVVENAPLLGLLFLHNNLHVVHHLRPGLPWYRIPAYYRAHRDVLLRQNGGLVYDGYGEIFRRYLFTQHDRPDHPDAGDPTGFRHAPF